MIPICTVHQIAFERVKAWDLWPFPTIETTQCCYKHVARVKLGCLAPFIADCQAPFALCLAPAGLLHSVGEVHVASDSVLVHNTLPVL